MDKYGTQKIVAPISSYVVLCSTYWYSTSQSKISIDSVDGWIEMNE